MTLLCTKKDPMALKSPLKEKIAKIKNVGIKILKAIHRVNFGHQLSNVVHKNCMFFIFRKRYLFFKLGAERCKHWPKFVKLFKAHFIQKKLRFFGNISLNTTISYKSIIWLYKLGTIKNCGL